MMNIKEALEKEIQYLNDEIRNSLEFADARNDIMIGRTTRHVFKQQIASYKRILNSLTEESKG